MQNVNSTQQFQKLKATIEQEEMEIKSLEDRIHRKQYEHKHAKDVFDKIDKEMKELENQKNILMNHRASLHREFTTLQKDIEVMNKRHGFSESIKK